MKRKNRFKLDTYKEGGNKSEWISNKISEIMKEGKYPQDQAIAIAYSMWENRKEDGGGIKDPIKNNSHLKNIYDVRQGVFNPSMGQGVQVFYRDPSDPKFNPETDLEFVKDDYFNKVQESQAYRDFMQRKSTNKPFVPSQLYGEYETPKYLPQKKIVDIKRDVRTEGKRQGKPAGTYTKVYYSDNTVDYIDKEGEPMLYQMSNYRDFMGKKQNPAPTFQNGGEWYKNNPPMFTTPFAEMQNATPYTNYNPLNKESIHPSSLVKDFSFSTEIDGFEQPVKQEQTTNDLLEIIEQKREKLNPKLLQEQGTYTQPPQFANPYGGFDTPTMTQMSGYYLGKGDYTKGAIAGTGALLGTARNFFSGLGAGNVEQESLKNYYQNQRDTMTRPSYQDGGQISQDQLLQQIAQALQQGIDPQQILQQLVQMGIPQEQGMEIIQQVSYQLEGQSPQEETMEGNISNLQEESQEQPVMQDGGYFLNQMKGKRIKDYKFNSETNSYDVEFE